MSPKNIGERSGFCQGFCSGGGKSFLKVPVEKGFLEEFEFSNFYLGGSLILKIYNVFRHFRHEHLKIFTNHGGTRLKVQFTHALAS